MASIFASFTDPTVANGPTLYKMATKPLSTQFDGSRSKHSVFQSSLRDKITECGWEHLITFDNKNLIDNPDSISVQTIKEAKAFRDLLIITGPRQAQADPPLTEITQEQVTQAQGVHFQSKLLHTVLSNSISGELLTHISNKKNRGESLGDGVLLLKAIQDKSLGTAVNQKMSNYRTQLKNLHIKQFKWNITQFNEQMLNIHLVFENHGEPYLDTDFSDVVQANYLLVKHDEFRLMIQGYCNECEIQRVNPDWKHLLEIGETKFKAMKEAGTWGKKTAAEEQLIALQACCDTLKARVAARGNSGGSNSGGNGGSGGGTNRNNSGNNGGTRRGGQKKSKHKEWQFKKPEGSQREKKVKVKISGEEKEVTYYWCPNHGEHGMWVRHKPADCKAKSNSDGPSLNAHQVILDGTDE